MPDRTESYFPPVDEYWLHHNKISATRIEPQPLLPTPISSTAPQTLGETLRESPPILVEAELPLLSTCSCPPTDSCVVESLSLILGSLNLLTLAGHHQRHQLETSLSRLTEPPTTSPESLRLEKCIQTLLAPHASSPLAIQPLLWQTWNLPSAPSSSTPDICQTLRQTLSATNIDIVNTFAPMQHSIHILLAIQNFTDPAFQQHLQHLKISEDVLPSVRLLLEANDQLSLFTMKAAPALEGAAREQLRAKLGEMEKLIDVYEPVLARKDSGMES